MAISFPRDWPGSIGIKSSRFGLSINQSEFGGDGLSRKSVIQSHAAGITDRWEGVITTVALKGATLAELRGFITSLRGREKTFYLGDPDMIFQRSGVMPGGGFTNWLKDGSRFDQSTWSDVGTPVVTANVDGTADSIQDDSASVSEARSQAFAIPDDDGTYTFSVRVKKAPSSVIPRCDIILSGGTQVSAATRFDANSGVQNTSGAATITDETTYWRVALTVQNNRTGNRTATVSIYPSIRATVNGADDVTQTGTITVKEAQVERASSASTYEDTTTGPQVNGVSQTGRTLITDGWIDGDVLLVGDYFAVNGELKVATEKATAVSGGVTISFDPPLRSSPADNAAITVVEPRATVRLTSPDQFWDVDDAGIGKFSFSFEDVI